MIQEEWVAKQSRSPHEVTESRDSVLASPTGRAKMTAAQAIVEILKRKGVCTVFGVPGAAILPVYDAMQQFSEIRSYVVRHEQTAAFAADGYSRVTGRVGVCMATSGPGSTNLVTGLYGAWFDSVPLIAFTGQVAVPFIGTAAFQEAPTTAVCAPVTKRTFLPREADSVPRIVFEAFKIATSGKMGPVLIDLPLDVQKTTIEVDLDAVEAEVELESAKREAAQWQGARSGSPEQLASAVDLILGAKSPVIVAGGGVILGQATEELRQLAELLAIPVVTALMGRGAIPADHPLSAGAVGTMCNTPLGNKTVLGADLIINLGGRFGDRSTGKIDVFQHGASVIHVNIDPVEVNKSVPATLGIVADVKPFLKELNRLLSQRFTKGNYAANPRVVQLAKDRVKLARKTDFDTLPIKPQRAIAELREFLDRDAIVSHDCGISQIWSAQLFDVYEPRTYLVTGGAGTMGWGLGAGMAAKLAKPETQCVNLVGDGSIGMSLQDIATLAKFNIPVVLYVLNNSLLGLIRQQQNWYYDERHISTDLDFNNAGHDRGIDFVKVAQGMGALAERVTKPEEIKPSLKRAFDSGRPYLIEVIVDPLAVCSMADDGTITGVKETT